MKIPVLHRHPTRDQGYVRVPITRQFVYFKSAPWTAGMKNPPPPVQAEYQKWLKDWLAANPAAATPKRLPPIVCPSVADLYERYILHCKGWYRDDDGKATSELLLQHTACVIAVRLYPMLPANDFGPQELLACRDQMVGKGWTRKSINKAIGRIRAMFRWGSEVEAGEIVAPEVWPRLLRLRGLKKNRCPGVREGKGRRPVDMDLVKQTLPLCAPVVQAMIWTQYYLMCRSEDVVVMRPADIDRTEKYDLWRYDVVKAKTAHHHADETSLEQQASKLFYPIIPVAQEILTPWIVKAGGFESGGFIFTTGGQRGVRSDSAGHYTPGSYRRHIERACDRLFPAPGKLARQMVTLRNRRGTWVRRLESEKERDARLTPAQRKELRAWQGAHSWDPYQLLHLRTTEIAAMYGTEAAQRWRQHEHLSTAEIYAEKRRDDVLKVAADVAKRMGRSAG